MITFYLIITTIILLYFLIEFILLSTALNKIKIRIIVNGTRGKSTTVQLLFKLLNSNGLRTYAKITGDDPIILKPDSSAELLKRYSPASIKENIKLLIQISKEKPDAVIFECMALHSETQNTLGKLILKPHFTIITNILPDHKEVMGNSIEENFSTMLECVHPNSTAIISNGTNKLLQKFGKEIPKKIIANDILFENYFENIPNAIVNESWSLLKCSAELLNIKEEILKNEFQLEWEKINRSIRLKLPKLNTDIWNLFSVNDIFTFNRFMKHSIKQSPSRSVLFVFNARSDRPLRTKEFAEYLAQNYSASKVWLIGDGKNLAKSILMKNNFDENNLFLTNENSIVDKIEREEMRDMNIYFSVNHKEIDKLNNSFKTLLTVKGVNS